MDAMERDVTAMMDNEKYSNYGFYDYPEPVKNVPGTPKSPDAGRTFHPFPKLPAELRRMVWREFYLEPRYFIVIEDGGVDHIDPGSQPDQWHTSYEDTQRMTAYSRCARYWRSIDTAIDHTSREVARGLRSRFWFPTWAFTYTNYVQNWLGSLPWRDPAKNPEEEGYQYPADIHINWDTDWINFNSFFFELSSGDIGDASIVASPKMDWLANIRNLSVPWHIPGYGVGDKDVNLSNESLWACCRAMPALAAVRGLLQLHLLTAATPRAIDMCASIDHFQRLHLLRQESCVNDHILGVKVDIICTIPGVAWPPSWSRLQALLSRARFLNEFEEDWAKMDSHMAALLKRTAPSFAEVDLSEDEVKGSEQLFRDLNLEPIQAAVRCLDDWIEYRNQLIP
ncbi:hypothetical protein CMUS01_16166 [Colletotrichum musicola]|uniref:2EXR domain-containing protein n=1 Tax=Colletotrichum musicola TaxID=2175873 RepID=A0A8H6IQZ3_9PEZI|nr:hypothetical protein CMUS01_16166 [Colletotrichum musicola]